jgi:hypothetical protein
MSLLATLKRFATLGKEKRTKSQKEKMNENDQRTEEGR